MDSCLGLPLNMSILCLPFLRLTYRMGILFLGYSKISNIFIGMPDMFGVNSRC